MALAGSIASVIADVADGNVKFSIMNGNTIEDSVTVSGGFIVDSTGVVVWNGPDPAITLTEAKSIDGFKIEYPSPLAIAGLISQASFQKENLDSGQTITFTTVQITFSTKDLV